MGSLPNGKYSPETHHSTMLQDVVGASFEKNILIRSYKSFSGFSAKITDSERQKLAEMKGVVSVFPSRIYQLHTTRSWGFMGFNKTTDHRLRNQRKERELVVGVIDNGIWPESQSFNDKGFRPPPKNWKGVCKGGKNFTCNNKIVGARYYITDSVRDTNGHGSHTASTAAGNQVRNVSFYGLAQGTARGGVPSARIAAYKVCNGTRCYSDAIMAAFDDAIADGVDVISISIGGDGAFAFTDDPIAIGAFHAMTKGIITVQSAGNSGPDRFSVGSVAPWILTAAATTIDRSFIDKVVLGNGKTLGKSINSFSLQGVKYPLVYGENVTKNCSAQSGKMCNEGCIDSALVKGKIVLCDIEKGSFAVRGAGGVGSVLVDPNSEKVSEIYSLPASVLLPDDYERVKTYLKTANNPVAEILKSETIENLNAPIIAFFSSRGPNSILPDIIKPDLTAPGVDILAAYSPLGSITGDYLDKRRVGYNILSGTSMASPHVSGAAAYVKSFHPDWSPSAIKSALMTTAWKMTRFKNADAEFALWIWAYQSLQAVDPGLIYEAGKEDYIKILCSSGYNSSQIKQLAGDNSTCKRADHKSLVSNLNYPSMAIKIAEPRKPFRIVFHRTVTNVGRTNTTYKAVISLNPNVNFKVVPRVLSFKSLNQKKSFKVKVSANKLKKPVHESLVWFDNFGHNVRSPIIVY
ncbi:LOW QUALITY PROTEIN: subtilisin-like protease SBT4.5 [Carica papaya]|uniref:LOW QUALITY PROTEIN: subtilisin-like protease SBT4.5 n=1 Tax=Carica papaya TaxID=3649 RepID=UPI000B8D0154|nr:LOW QUALITY PROTEIN: subtilisin-like protease SBT4.5 [Carica papaya]